MPEKGTKTILETGQKLVKDSMKQVPQHQHGAASVVVEKDKVLIGLATKIGPHVEVGAEAEFERKQRPKAQIHGTVVWD